MTFTTQSQNIGRRLAKRGVILPIYLALPLSPRNRLMKQLKWDPDVSLEIFLYWWVEDFNGWSVRTSLAAYYKLSVHVICGTSICYRNVSPTVGWSGRRCYRTVYTVAFDHKTVVDCVLNKSDKNFR